MAVSRSVQHCGILIAADLNIGPTNGPAVNLILRYSPQYIVQYRGRRLALLYGALAHLKCAGITDEFASQRVRCTWGSQYA